MESHAYIEILPKAGLVYRGLVYRRAGGHSSLPLAPLCCRRGRCQPVRVQYAFKKTCGPPNFAANLILFLNSLCLAPTRPTAYNAACVRLMVSKGNQLRARASTRNYDAAGSSPRSQQVRHRAS
jgi:hypothetical protein